MQIWLLQFAFVSRTSAALDLPITKNETCQSSLIDTELFNFQFLLAGRQAVRPSFPVRTTEPPAISRGPFRVRPRTIPSDRMAANKEVAPEGLTKFSHPDAAMASAIKRGQRRGRASL